jgi:L-lactate utilization protein LutC
MSRSEVLSRLHALLDEAAPLPSAIPAFPRFEDPVATFRAEAERVGARVIEGLSLEAALSQVLVETRENQLHWQGTGVLDSRGIEYRLNSTPPGPGLLHSTHAESRVAFPLELSGAEYTRNSIADVRISVGNAVYGVAETGTIVETVASGWGRVLPILSPCHVSLLSKEDLLMNQAELFTTLDLRSGGSARLLMTGPSRTADIEKTLILGVHGPRTLYVILVP